MKDANYGCKGEGNDDGVSGQSVVRGVCDVEDGGASDGEDCGKVK